MYLTCCIQWGELFKFCQFGLNIYIISNKASYSCIFRCEKQLVCLKPSNNLLPFHQKLIQALIYINKILEVQFVSWTSLILKFTHITSESIFPYSRKDVHIHFSWWILDDLFTPATNLVARSSIALTIMNLWITETLVSLQTSDYSWNWAQ